MCCGRTTRATCLSLVPQTDWSFQRMFYERREDILNRILQRVEVIDLGSLLDGQSSPCHIWQGPTSGEGKGGGYGRMSLNGQTVAVHLVIFTHYYGYIPGKKQIDHLCNNRLCCNHLHLEMVSHLTNQRRRAQRAKLTCSPVTGTSPVPATTCLPAPIAKHQSCHQHDRLLAAPAIHQSEADRKYNFRL